MAAAVNNEPRQKVKTPLQQHDARLLVLTSLLAQLGLGTLDSPSKNGRWKKSKPFGWASKGYIEHVFQYCCVADWCTVLTSEPPVAMVLESGG